MLTTTSAAERKKFDTYAAMERQLEASRQLRADAFADAIASALAAVAGAIRHFMLRITVGIPN